MANDFMDVMKWKKWNVIAKNAQKALDKYDYNDDDDVCIQDIFSWNRSDVTDGFYNNIVEGGLYQLHLGKNFIVLGKGKGSDEISELAYKFKTPELEYSISYNNDSGDYRFCQNDWVVVVMMDNELFFVCEELGHIKVPNDMFEYFYENFEPGWNFSSSDVGSEYTKLFEQHGKYYASLVEGAGTRDANFNINFFSCMKRIA